MRKSRRKWAGFSKILGWERADARISSTLYKEVVQETLLFVLLTWVTTPKIGRTLGGFHHRVDRCLLGINLR